LLAPLPRLYRIVVVAVVLALGLAGGVWLAQEIALPAGGLLVGCVGGILVAYLLIHDFHHHQPRPARIPRRH
jgi:hypothetical protein